MQETLLKKIIELNEAGFKFWIEGDKLKYQQSRESLDKEAYVAWLQDHRLELIGFLKFNGLNSADYNIPYIYKIDENNNKLSFAQERLWFIDKYEDGTTAYNVPMIFEVAKDVSLERLMRCLELVVERHAILRTLIKDDDKGMGYQQVMALKDKPLNVKNSVVENQAELERIFRERIRYLFNLSEEYPVQFSLYSEKSQGKKYLSVVVHHIAFDGWSVDIFLKDLYRYYRGEDLEELPIQYQDFSLWQRVYLSGERLERQLIYWKEQLKNHTPLNLITDKPRHSTMDYRGARVSFSLDKQQSMQLRMLAKQCGVSLYSALLSAYYLMLRVYSNQSNVIVGCLVANRHYGQIQNVIGFFVNSLVLNIEINSNFKVKEFIKVVADRVVGAQLHQDVPFEKLVEVMQTEKDTSRHPLFQVLFSVGNFGAQENQEFLYPYKIESEVSKYDLSVDIKDDGDELLGCFNYAVGLFERGTVDRFIETYKEILRQFSVIAVKADYELSKLRYVDEERANIIIYQWNDTKIVCPINKTLAQLFEEQVEKTPGNVALVFQDKQFSYQDLNEQSNKLACFLREQYKIKANDLIGFCLDRSELCIIAILGILKSGGAYVPMDPDYPSERLNYILEDTQVKITLINERHKIKFSHETEVLEIDTHSFKQKLQKYSGKNLELISRGEDLAYVIYTSGTTGHPKGVMIEQRNVTNFLTHINLGSMGTWLALTNVTFDISVLELLGSLLRGFKIVLMPENKGNQEVLLCAELIKKYNVSHLQCTPSLAHVIFEEASAEQLKSLQQVLIGGEVMTESLVVKIRHLVDATIYNMYGPTEATIWATAEKIDENGISIGRPLSNMKAYVLNEDKVLCGIGMVGELYLGGEGVARGYWRKEKLTNERFVECYIGELKERLYKTGDLCRYLPDGRIDYIGRNDFQVKVRGHRIELEEIESVLNEYPGISQSVVLVRTLAEGQSSSNDYLIGYYVAKQPLDEEVVLHYLESKLPSYMVPNTLIYLQTLPVTINGKLNRNALPLLEAGYVKSYVAPRNELEMKVCAIYAAVLVLDIATVGINDSFFKLGGNSILVIQLKKALNQQPEFYSLSVADLFKYDSVSKLVDFVYLNDKPLSSPRNPQKNLNHEIAIIGMSGAFSGVTSIAEFWQVIVNQQESVKTYSLDECRRLEVREDLILNPHYIPVSGALSDVDLFDPYFWGISVNEAKLVDPQFRKFVEHCWYVLERSGYIRCKQEKNIGVFAGSGMNPYFYDNILYGEEASKVNRWEAAMLNMKDALATWTAYLLGLTGPANSINTACSTGLVTVVEACQKLQLRACDMALAGSVSLAMPDEVGYVYQQGMIFSHDGHCRTFDKAASGTVSGSGVGVVLLKRLDDALRDRDNVIAVISGYHTNNDGNRKVGYTAPSVTGQAECILSAQKMADISADQVDYIECHGTATHLGDPIEVQALKEAFLANTASSFSSDKKCYLGAVKANIGHADSAAGIAGLIKVCNMLQHSVIPGQVNFTEANPELRLEKTHFAIARKNKTWSRNANKARFAGVSSFGVGGTNAHIIVGDNFAQLFGDDHLAALHKDQKLLDRAIPPRYLFPLSAKSHHSLMDYKRALIDYLQSKGGDELEFEKIANTLQSKREAFNYRICFVAQTKEALIDQLTSVNSTFRIKTEGEPKLIFMFPGQGAQYQDMAIDLYQNEVAFKSIVNEVIHLANQYLHIDISKILFPSLYPSALQEDLKQTKWAQISLFIISYSLAKYLQTLGIKAEAYIGHSLGEYVAACLAGVFSLSDAVKLVIFRGKIMQEMVCGGMLAINISYDEEILKIITEHDCEVVALNSPEDIVVAGNEDDITSLNNRLNESNISAIRLNVSHAYHSRMMEEASLLFQKSLSDIVFNNPTDRFISNVSGKWAANEVAQVEYWGAHLRSRVEFSQGIETIVRAYSGNVLFIEVGVGKSLSHFVKNHKHNSLSLNAVQLLPSFREWQKQVIHSRTKEDLFCHLWEGGAIVYLDNYIKDSTVGTVFDLPAYQFDFKSCWIKKKPLVKVSNDQLNDVSTVDREIQRSIVVLEEACSDLEYEVAQVFFDILGVEEVSVHDDFFRLGGNSILALKLVHQLNSQVFDANIFKIDMLYSSGMSNIKKIAAFKENYEELTVYNQGEI